MAIRMLKEVNRLPGYAISTTTTIIVNDGITTTEYIHHK